MPIWITFSVKVHHYIDDCYRKFTTTGTLNIYSFVGNKWKIVNLLRILVMKMDTLNRKALWDTQLSLIASAEPPQRDQNQWQVNTIQYLV